MIVLSGASASGKTEVAKMLATKYGITKVITTTTRDKRLGEVDGKDYFFVSKETFEKMLKENKFVEFTIYNGNYYGSTKDQVSDDKCIVIDPVGLRSYSALKNSNIITMILDATEETRFKRMIVRGDPLEKAKERISNDRIIFSPKNIPPVNFHIESETSNVEEVADVVYEKYMDMLKK